MMLADVPMSTLSTTTSLQHAQEGKCMCKHCTAHFLRYLGLQLTTASALCPCYSLHNVFTLTHIRSWYTVSFPVPWGQISGKSWGKPDGRPVLALHGMCQQCKPACKPALSWAFTCSVIVRLPSTHLQGGWTMLAVLISSFPCFLKVQWIIQSLFGSYLPIMTTLLVN